jgi:hypothetical protein
MKWYVYLAHFFAGVFLANGVPHFVQGISGRSFQSPFAYPPGKGLSPPIVNVVWGFVNFVIGYSLLAGIGPFVICLSFDALGVALGGLLISIILAWHFGRLDK